MPPRPSLLVAVIGFLAVGTVSAASGGRVGQDLQRREVVVRGEVRAELRYTLHGKLATGKRTTTAFHLEIARSGDVLVDESLLSTKNGLDLSPKGLGAKPSLSVVDLEGDGEREVVVNTVTCPGHCYFFTYIYRYLPRRAEYDLTTTLWASDYTFTRLDADAVPEFRTYDYGFAGVFSCQSCDGWPVQVFHFDHGRWVNVTRRYPKLALADANRWRIAYVREKRQRYVDVRPLLAAYVADTYTARRASAGWAFAFSALRRGDLDVDPPDSVWPSGASYLRKLARVLWREHYAPTTRIAGIPATTRCRPFAGNGARFSLVVADGVSCRSAQALLRRSTRPSIRAARGRWKHEGFVWRWNSIDASLAYVVGRAGKAAVSAKWSRQSSTRCHPNYSPCLPITGDLDCDEIADSEKPIHIRGSDPYRLDSDHDGLGCEEER